MNDRTNEFKALVNPALPSRAPPAQSNWIKQAEQVATNLRSFSHFLASVQPAAHHAHSSLSSSPHRPSSTLSNPDSWSTLRTKQHLTEREQDQLDLGVQTALRRSVDRVRQLEDAETARQTSELPPSSASTSVLSRFLPLTAPTPSAASSALTTHRACVTHYLNSLLAAVSRAQLDQQEARVKAQLARRAEMGGGKGLVRMGLGAGGMGEGLEKARVGEVPLLYKPQPLARSVPSNGHDSVHDPEKVGLDDDSPELTEEQIQLFESESSALLSATQTDLASLQTAERSLLEISALQSTLVAHLTSQAELTDRLWDEAVGVSGKVEEGNKELKRAGERGRESRVWLLAFLIMSSFTLVFLDYYS